MKRRFNETIDGSIKNIIQLKTVNNSLEWSQMYDALEDCPVEFINKLIQTLNSLGETMGVDPTQTFDKVLCNVNDDNEETRKKMYNWWRGVFEVLGSCKNSIPKDREDEFNQKVDALMAEILKSGDGQNTAEEEPEEEDGEGAEGQVMLEEEYEPADKEDETNMLTDMKWAVGKIGEIANRVQELINFVNPYCEVNESMMNNKPARYSIGDHVLYNGEECVVTDIDEDLRNDEEIYQVSRDSDKVRGLSFNDWATSDELELINGFEKEDKSNMKKKTIWKEIRQTSQDDWVDAREVFELAEEDSGSDIVKTEGGEADDGSQFWKDMDKIDDLEKKGYWSGKFKVGDKVTWIDPDGDEIKPGYEVVEVPEPDDDGEIPEDGIYVIVGDDGSEAEVYGKELRPANMNESDLENELNAGDDGWKEIGQPVGESKPVELESTDWKDITETLSASELEDSLRGCDFTDLEVVDVDVNGEDDLFLTVKTSTDKKPEIVGKVNDALLSNVDNWEIGKVVSQSQDEEGNFVTELLLNRLDVVDEETADEVKPDDGSDKQFSKDGEKKTLVTGEENKKEMSDLEAATIMGSASATDMDAADMGLVSQDVADPYNKKPVCEMTIEQEVTDPWKLAELLWGQGKENLEDLLRQEGVDGNYLMQILEDYDVHNLTQINDLFAYDFETVLDSMGFDPEAWSQNLEFVKRA